jgi:hypothetical protein
VLGSHFLLPETPMPRLWQGACAQVLAIDERGFPQFISPTLLSPLYRNTFATDMGINHSTDHFVGSAGVVWAPRLDCGSKYPPPPHSGNGHWPNP